MSGSCSNVIDEFKWHCDQLSTQPPPQLLQQLRGEGERGAGTLYLNSRTCSVPVCRVLSSFLPRTDCIYTLDLSDCLLTQDCLYILLSGLMQNTSVLSLSLKGNNLCGNCISELGRFLQFNQTINRLSLEWNCITADMDSFPQFCSGLSKNRGLEYLDLRNNQLTHAAVISLVSALQSNTTLKYLDLRWNNIGVLGGNSVLQLLQTNRSLERIELQGNHIPKDLVRAIESELLHNLEKGPLGSEVCSIKGSVSSNSPDLIKEKVEMAVEPLLHHKLVDLDSEVQFQQQEEINRLLLLLEEKKSELSKLHAKNEVVQAELRLEQGRVKELKQQDKARENLVTSLREEWVEKEEHMKKEHQHSLVKLSKETRESEQEKRMKEKEKKLLHKGSEESQVQITQLHKQVRQFEDRLHREQEERRASTETFIREKEELRNRLSSLEQEQEKYRRTMEKADGEVQVWMRKYREQEVELEGWMNKCKDMEDDLEDVEAKCKEVEDDVTFWKEKFDQLEHKYESLEEKLEDLEKARIDQLELEEKRWEAEKEEAVKDLKDKMDDLEEQLNSMEKDKDEVEASQQQLQDQVEVSKVEVDRMKEILAKQEDRLQEEETRNSELLARILGMEEEEKEREEEETQREEREKSMEEERLRWQEEKRKRDEQLLKREADWRKREERMTGQVHELNRSLQNSRIKIKEKDEIIRKIRLEETVRARSLYKAVKTYMGEANSNHLDPADPFSSLPPSFPPSAFLTPFNYADGGEPGGKGKGRPGAEATSSSGADSSSGSQSILSVRETSFHVNGDITNGSEHSNGNIQDDLTVVRSANGVLVNGHLNLDSQNGNDIEDEGDSDGVII